MNIDVCVSTIDDGLERLVGRLTPAAGVTFLVGLQSSTGSPTIPSEWSDYTEDRIDIRLHLLQGTGLSRSRNDLIKLSTSEVIMFVDDDVYYISGFESRLQAAFSEEAHADVIIFPYESDRLTKRNAQRIYNHNIVTAARISSIEIAVRRRVLTETGVRFDERFGLGTERPSGEEYVFIVDLIHAGKRAINYPSSLVRHNHESSGPTYFSNKKKIATKGAMFKRALPLPISWLMIILFSLKKYSDYRREIGLVKFTRIMFSAPRLTSLKTRTITD